VQTFSKVMRVRMLDSGKNITAVLPDKLVIAPPLLKLSATVNILLIS